jgi:hypothetical protein
MRTRFVWALGLTVMFSAVAASGPAKGTMVFKNKGKEIKTTFAHAFLVKGPDGVDVTKVLRRVLLTNADIAAKLKACETMACIDAAFGSGLQVDWDAGPRLLYWLTLNDHSVQFSGTADPKAFTPRELQDTRIAGRLTFDATFAGGPNVDVEFDAPLVKEIRKRRD